MEMQEALQVKKRELESLQTDIDLLDNQAAALKDSVKKYNELKSKSAQLKKTQKLKQKQFDTVTSFLSSVDENYLTKLFPLFADEIKHKAEETTEEKKEDAA